MGLAAGPAVFCTLTWLLLSAPAGGFAQETNAPASAPSAGVEATNSPDSLRAILEFEAQLKANQIAIEQNGKEAREAAARNADLLSRGLQTIETAFSAEGRALAERNERELQAVRSSTKILVIIGGIFAAVASLALFMVTYLQYRMSKAWAEVSAGLPASWKLGGGSDMRELGPGASRAVGTSPAEDSSTRLLRALERLETRVHDLEQSSASSSSPAETVPHQDNGNSCPTPEQRPAMGAEEACASGDESAVFALLEEGQSMVKHNDWESALKCFNEVLALDPNHSEALVKKGATLEHLKKLNEAFACYDQAIAADGSMTIAYLHKGGLCSRLERFKEALECYEKALKTHNDW